MARVGGVPIFASQVAAQAVKSKVGAQDALKELVKFQLLAEKAREVGVPFGDPALASALRAIRVQRLIERDIEPQLTIDRIPAETLRPVYERNINRFVHPRLVGIDIMAIFTGTTATAARKVAAQQTAVEMDKYLSSQPDRETLDVKALVASASWAGRGISYSRAVQGPTKPYIPKVGAAVQKLKRKGEWTPIIDDSGETGFYIARYIEETPPKNVSFAEALPEMRAHYFEEWKPIQFTALVRDLEKRRKVQFDPTTLATTSKP